MEKVLLVGKFTDYLRELNKRLIKKYEVRTCVNKLEIFKGMFKLNKPDIVVFLLNEMNETNEEILKELREEHSEIQVICAGIEVEEKKIEELDIASFIFVTIPYTEEELMKVVENVLAGNYVSKPIHEKMDEQQKDEIVEERVDEEKGDKEEPRKQEIEKKWMGNTRKTILLVDDSGIFLRMLNGLLSDDYDIRMATSGLKALTSIREKKPDLILLDYEMPMYDGRETMIKIREKEENRDIPIVFVTAVNKKEHIKAVLALKPAGYLLKPIDRDRLFQTVKDIIG